MNPMYGKTISEETRIKMSISHKNCKLCKSIFCVETGEIFISTVEAANKLKLSQSSVSSVARGACKHTRGYHFEYIS